IWFCERMTKACWWRRKRTGSTSIGKAGDQCESRRICEPLSIFIQTQKPKKRVKPQPRQNSGDRSQETDRNCRSCRSSGIFVIRGKNNCLPTQAFVLEFLRANRIPRIL